MNIAISDQQKKIKLNLESITYNFKKWLKILKMQQAEISILFTDDKYICQLNKSFRGVNKPTDILAFSMRERKEQADPLPPHSELLGDLVVSVNTIERQAKTNQVEFEAEMNFILLHGLLHLLGYDHKYKTDSMRMSNLHKILLQTAKKVRE